MATRKKSTEPSRTSLKEMPEVDFGSGLVFRGLSEWRRYINWKRGYARLDPDLRELFPDDRRVNEVLRHAVEIGKIQLSGKRKKSA